jgi:16S rRNA (cytosine967-C5)-methyltransferase
VSNQKPREIAALLLAQPPDQGGFLEDRVETALGENPILPVDRRLVQELIYGVTRWQATLDWLIARKASRPIDNPLSAVLLRLGLYQLFWLSRIPDHAAVNETVAMARSLGCSPQAGFINAVLRGYTREKAETRELLENLKITEPAVGYSHPAWLVDRWRARWGEGELPRLLAGNNQPPEMFARVNTLKMTALALIQAWDQEGVVYEPVQRDWIADGEMFLLKTCPPLGTLPSFQKGGFYVQDSSTLLAVRLLDPQPGEAVLDACAAPGGKATLMAQRMQNQGRLVAQDTDPRRRLLLHENLTRLGVTCAVIHSVPVGPISPSGVQYDRALVDVPCSNTGVLRRRVELRWRVQPGEITRLVVEQGAILRRVAQQVKPRGCLVYSTCSLEPEENHEVVKRFLAQTPGWKLEQERQLLPFRDGADGAYAALLRH